MLKKVLLISAFTAASVFATTAFAEETADTLKAATEAAVASQKAAKEASGEWVYIGTLLKDSAKEGEAGNFDKAVELAKRADEHSKLGIAQMESQTNLEFPDYFTK